MFFALPAGESDVWILFKQKHQFYYAKDTDREQRLSRRDMILLLVIIVIIKSTFWMFDLKCWSDRRPNDKRADYFVLVGKMQI